LPVAASPDCGSLVFFARIPMIVSRVTSPAGLANAVTARRLSPEARRDAMTHFFRRYPGTDRGPLGLGRAMVEFLDWLVSSGRIGGEGGSPWWSALNGHLVLD